MEMYVFILQILLFFLFVWIFKKKNINFVKAVERINGKIYIIVLIMLSAALPFLYIGEGHDWGGDFSCYIAQAQSILSGTMQEQVDTNTFIVTNSSFMHGPGSYPWGYPLLLAPIIKLFGVNYMALKCVNVVLFALCAVVFYMFLKEKISLGYARLGVFFVVANPAILAQCNGVLSDIEFLLLSLLSIYFIDKLFLSDKRQVLYGVLSGVSCFGAYFVRTNGIVSVLTILAIEVFLLLLKIKPLRKFREKLCYPKQKPLAHLAAYAVFLCGAVLDKVIFPSGGSSYGYYFRFFSARSLMTNFKDYFTSCCNAFTLDIGVAIPIAFILMLLFVYGIKKELFKELPSFVYIAGMFVLVVIFPAYQGIRYLNTILPLIIMVCLKAIDDLERDVIKDNRAKSFYRLAANSFICVIIASVIITTGLHARRVVLYDTPDKTNASYTETAVEAYEYIKSNTDEDDVIEFFKPRVLWLNTHRKSFSLGDNYAEKINELDYVLISEENVNKGMKEYCESSETATVVFSNEDFTLYSLNN